MADKETHETVETWILNKDVTAKKVSLSDLYLALDWLGSYETESENTAQSLANAMSFLVKEINKRNRKKG